MLAPLRLSILSLIALSPALLAQTAPVAFDDAYTTAQGDNLSVDAPGPLENDDDDDGDSLTAVLVDDSGTVGNLLLLSDGSFEYEPNGFVGSESFTYVANDGTSDSNEATITFTVSGIGTGVTTYTDESLFLAALADLGYDPVFEGFEDGNEWPRSPTLLPSVTSQGLTWTSPIGSSEITTGSGPAHNGNYGFYSIPHGNYGAGPQCNQPGVCTDRWLVNSDTPLVAFGGWVRTLGNGGSVSLYIDGDIANPIDPYPGHIYSWVYMGVVAPAGFSSIEIRETDGVTLDAFFIFADSFTFARAPNGPWTDLGSGLGGTHGVPSLVAMGELLGGDALSVTLSSALESSTARLVIGLSAINAPFKGGVLVPRLSSPPKALPTGATGTLVLQTTWPTGVTGGFRFYTQMWIADSAGPVGFAASNALAADVP